MNPSFKKKKGFSKVWLKLTNKKKYKLYKELFNEQKDLSLFQSARAENIQTITEKISVIDAVGVLHSGNSGDIIYSLPTLKRLNTFLNKEIKFYLRLNQPLKISSHYTHPLGNVMLNEKMANMLIPLLSNQDYIACSEVYEDQNVHLDLDSFRTSGILQDRGDIARWCSYMLGVNPELHKAWIEVEANKSFNDTIIVARSERYRNPLINYNFLAKYPQVSFVGVESEFLDIKKMVPNIKWIQVGDFRELAEIIAGCKLFIGNQSFPFSIAEGLKVPRILELFWKSPNVIVSGDNGYDFIYQDHFEWLVNYLYEGKILN